MLHIDWQAKDSLINISLLSSSGKDYYMNIYTKESQWEIPTDPASERPERPEKVTASHLLVKHRASRRPQNWRGETITRSKDEALELLAGKGLLHKYGEIVYIIFIYYQ